MPLIVATTVVVAAIIPVPLVVEIVAVLTTAVPLIATAVAAVPVVVLAVTPPKVTIVAPPAATTPLTVFIVATLKFDASIWRGYELLRDKPTCDTGNVGQLP